MAGEQNEKKKWLNLYDWARHDEETGEAAQEVDSEEKEASKRTGLSLDGHERRMRLVKRWKRLRGNKNANEPPLASDDIDQVRNIRVSIPLKTADRGIDTSSEHKPGSRHNDFEKKAPFGCDDVAFETVIAPQPEIVEPGAFAVGSSHSDGVTMDDTSADEIVEDHSADVDDTPVTAELVDFDKENRRVSQQIELGIQKERERAPVAEIVEDPYRRYRRRTLGVVFVIAVALLAVLLGVFLSKDPPAPPPPIEDIILTVAPLSSDGGVAMQTPGTPQNRALTWVANDTFAGYRSEEKVIQRYALATIFFATNGDAWFNNSLWLDGGDECGRWWQFVGGLSCESPSKGLTRLELDKNNLNGTLPPEISLLTSLASLSLSQNDLFSTIPSEIVELMALEYLNIKGSNLYGGIPVHLSNLTAMKSLNLADNDLVGSSFVESLGRLTNMEEIFLYGNGLNGSLPSDIAKLSHLKNLNINSNALVGSIPPGFGDLSLLAEVHLQKNELTGEIPSELGKLTAITRLNLNANNLRGSIPPFIANMIRLKTLFLHENALTGSIPEIALSKLTNLEQLNIRENEITGAIPSEIGRLTLLQSLFLHQNMLTSSIPSEITKLTNLESINLRKNGLTGKLPLEIGNLSLLKELELRENKLSGSLPAGIIKLSILEELSVRHNLLRGPLPPGFGNMTSLKILQLRENSFEGTLPSEVGLLLQLTDLNIRDNKMTGDIPNEIYRLTNLVALNIGNTITDGGNTFRGSIPSTIALMTSLEGLLLHNINIYGTIPPIEKLTNLRALWLQGNDMTGEIPSAIHTMEELDEVFLYNNGFVGSFSCPEFVEKCLVSCDDPMNDTCRVL